MIERKKSDDGNVIAGIMIAFFVFLCGFVYFEYGFPHVKEFYQTTWDRITASEPNSISINIPEGKALNSTQVNEDGIEVRYTNVEDYDYEQPLGSPRNPIRLEDAWTINVFEEDEPEEQSIHLAGNPLTISAAGGSFSISDIDNDPTNEIQDLTGYRQEDNIDNLLNSEDYLVSIGSKYVTLPFQGGTYSFDMFGGNNFSVQENLSLPPFNPEIIFVIENNDVIHFTEFDDQGWLISQVHFVNFEKFSYSVHSWSSNHLELMITDRKTLKVKFTEKIFAILHLEGKL